MYIFLFLILAVILAGFIYLAVKSPVGFVLTLLKWACYAATFLMAYLRGRLSSPRG
jgi:hypothetical protein